VALSESGEARAAGGCKDPFDQVYPREICVWDAQSDRELLRIRYESLYEHPVSVAFSDEARFLAVAQPKRGEVELWDVVTRRQIGSVGALSRPGLDGAFVRAIDGRVDFVGHDAPRMEARLLCRLGAMAVNFMACRDRFLAPGLLPRILAEP
jgi:WD40 repeat protein